jgi:hypothetical protein
MADRDNKCKHTNCSCPATGDSDYCSAACESAGTQGLTGIACECGHSSCAGEIDQ